MTAFGNVAYPLRCRGVKRAEIAQRVERALTLVGIPELSRSYPNQMSGGQQQRVALARALVSNSDLVLFDEPLSNVDAKVREQLRYELMSMQQELGFAALYVTHDQTEAMELANDIVVLEAGRIAQAGSPQHIYAEPKSRYVAGFIGTINEMEGTVRELEQGGRARVETQVGVLEAGAVLDGIGVGDKVAVICRPERVAMSTSELPLENTWRATVNAAFFSGARTEHVIDFGNAKPFRIWHADMAPLPAGTEVWAGVATKDLRVIPWTLEHDPNA
jgi:iron(III) transport system ATP-binding protein